MVWGQAQWARLAALSGFLAVAAGAFAAHGLADPTSKELMRTGSSYEAIHALAMLACAALVRGTPSRHGLAPGLFLTGTLLFSGSLYALAFGAPRWAGAITPVGGLLLLGGWAALAWRAGGLPDAPPSS